MMQIPYLRGPISIFFAPAAPNLRRKPCSIRLKSCFFLPAAPVLPGTIMLWRQSCLRHASLSATQCRAGKSCKCIFDCTFRSSVLYYTVSSKASQSTQSYKNEYSDKTENPKMYGYSYTKMEIPTKSKTPKMYSYSYTKMDSQIQKNRDSDQKCIAIAIQKRSKRQNEN